MKLTILGEHPFRPSATPQDRCRIATIFVDTAKLVTVPGVHATQRIAYMTFLDNQRALQGQPPLPKADKQAIWNSAVDLIIEGADILIRPDAGNMPLAFEADDLLQELVSKRRIRFLYVRQPRVQQAIRERGEYWRISPKPESPNDIRGAIENARISITGRPIYYYNAVTGTRFLSLASFAQLADLPTTELRLHLAEIRDYSAKTNRRGYREIAFFAADKTFASELFAPYEFEHGDPAEVRAWHAELSTRFQAAVPGEFHEDNPADLTWRNRMFACLMDGRDATVLDELLPCCTPEFFRQIQWLPGGRIENGELLFDSVFDEWERNPEDPELAGLCDQKVKGFICNYIREFGTLHYVNIGRLTPSIRRRAGGGGHRAYIAEVKCSGTVKGMVRILRVQRWGIREHLNDFRDLLWAIIEAEEYTEYTLDRRLGCWELGMPIPGRINTRRVRETYYGPNQQHNGATRIWTTYYERDFIEGVATDKIPDPWFQDVGFSLGFARLLGRAAAPNLVVGRVARDDTVVFDTGDEMLILHSDGSPDRIVVADHASTFTDYEKPLLSFVQDYARPVTSRLHLVPDPETFRETYIRAFAERLREMQLEHSRRRGAFDKLFQHSKQGEGTFSWRWARVLTRLDSTDVDAFTDALRRACVQSQPASQTP